MAVDKDLKSLYFCEYSQSEGRYRVVSVEIEKIGSKFVYLKGEHTKLTKLKQCPRQPTKFVSCNCHGSTATYFQTEEQAERQSSEKNAQLILYKLKHVMHIECLKGTELVNLLGEVRELESYLGKLID
jgi:hypothetical protein